jgi:PAS domain S-box-containing protein
VTETAGTEALQAYADFAPVFIYVVDDATDELLLVNRYYANTLGVPAERMVGRRCWEFVMGPDGAPCRECPRRAEVDSEETFAPKARTVDAFNPTLGLWVRCHAQEITWTDGRPAHMITAIDTSNEKLLAQELSRLAYYDRDLHIPNRIMLERDLARRPAGNYCIIAYDVISMRYLNDAYGRDAVDLLLQHVIAWIRSFNLQNFEIYRVDGDCFALLFDDADMMSASGLADRIFERFSEPWVVNMQGEEVGISCRVSLCVLDGKMGGGSPASVITFLERTLTVSKETGAVAVFDEKLDEIFRREMALEMNLKNCISSNMQGFDVFYQPIVSPQTGTWVGLEALCRWDSPQFGQISPMVFIRMAEQIGLVHSIGYWVLNEALRVCAGLGLHEREGFFLDINLSPSQMSDESLVSRVLAALQQYQFPGANLVLEITESPEVEETELTDDIIEKLRALEIRLALDDFGTAYSNFNNLRRMPVSFLKTEKRFIDDIVEDTYQQQLSGLLIQLAHKAGMTLIAEGVEREDQLREVVKNGADLVQGQLFAAPMRREDLQANMRNFIEPNPLFAALETAQAPAEEGTT